MQKINFRGQVGSFIPKSMISHHQLYCFNMYLLNKWINEWLLFGAIWGQPYGSNSLGLIVMFLDCCLLVYVLKKFLPNMFYRFVGFSFILFKQNVTLGFHCFWNWLSTSPSPLGPTFILTSEGHQFTFGVLEIKSGFQISGCIFTCQIFCSASLLPSTLSSYQTPQVVFAIMFFPITLLKNGLCH
jgi:hypothetical protein